MASPPSSSANRFVSWNGGCLFIGTNNLVVPRHAHYAIQIAFGREFGIAFRASDDLPWIEYGGAIIPSRQTHSMDPTRVTANAVMFIEPETREGRVLDELYLGGGITRMPEASLPDARVLFDRYQSSNEGALIAGCMHLVRSLTGDMEPRVAADDRILRAIDYINANLDRKISLEAAAAEVFLSPSRFRHLFAEETGMAFRPYILWRRFLLVWQLVTKGATMSEAAHAAGFADAAHLTRTSRRMFGFPPSVMVMRR